MTQRLPASLLLALVLGLASSLSGCTGPEPFLEGLAQGACGATDNCYNRCPDGRVTDPNFPDCTSPLNTDYDQAYGGRLERH